MALPTAHFGSTGHISSRIIFGAAALGAMNQDRADATIEQVVAAGVNHFDTASSYGESELRLAPWLATRRSEVFLATKTRERSGDAARAELELSLVRLGVDQVDLIQLHNLVEQDEWEKAHGPGGVLQAMAQARDEGLVRFIGVTGHGTRIAGMHLKSLAEFDYASVLFPHNTTMMASDAYRNDVEELLGVCAEKQVAAQTIKAIARGRWPEGFDGKRFSWYEPLEDADAIGRAVRAILADPQLFLNTTSDARKLAVIFDAVTSGLAAPTQQELLDDVATFGISPLFDGRELERI
jgi:aryl-alcohol dehydrogenase-like predicted oxidoreductase